MMSNRLLSIVVTILVAQPLIAAKPDRKALQAIDSVAIVDFKVPWYIQDMKGEFAMGLGMIKGIKNRKREGGFNKGLLNGDEAVHEVLLGFRETLAAEGIFALSDHPEVLEAPEIKGLAESHPPDEPGYGYATVPGLPNCGREQFQTVAGQAATALGVDAVIFVTFDSLRYEATDYVGAGNLGPTGKAKAVGTADLFLLDRDGAVVWNLSTSVLGKRGTWVAGGLISPTEWGELNYGAGADLAVTLAKKHRKFTK